MRFLIIYFLDQGLFFGTVLGHFSQCNFKIFHRCPTMVTDIFTQPTLHPPSSTWLCSNSIENNCNSRIISYPLNSLLLWSVLFQLWGSHSFLQGWKLPFSEGAPTPSPPPSFCVPRSFWSKFKKLHLLSESHPNWCM